MKGGFLVINGLRFMDRSCFPVITFIFAWVDFHPCFAFNANQDLQCALLLELFEETCLQHSIRIQLIVND